MRVYERPSQWQSSITYLMNFFYRLSHQLPFACCTKKYIVHLSIPQDGNCWVCNVNKFWLAFIRRMLDVHGTSTRHGSKPDAVILFSYNCVLGREGNKLEQRCPYSDCT